MQEMYYAIPRRPRPILNVPKPVEYYSAEYRFRRHVYQPPVTQTYFTPPPKVFYQPPPIRYEVVEPPMIYNYYIPQQFVSPAKRQTYTIMPPWIRIL
ncbi:hypothetical protein KEJ47_10370 [Candidatus Bathyarchaeota archaeon]|nr:hypothetical protein [Candidatus Bathyarchaeota archaeon]